MHAQCVPGVAGTSSGLVVEEAGYIVYGGWDGVVCAMCNVFQLVLFIAGQQSGNCHRASPSHPTGCNLDG